MHGVLMEIRGPQDDAEAYRCNVFVTVVVFAVVIAPIQTLEKDDEGSSNIKSGVVTVTDRCASKYCLPVTDEREWRELCR